MTGHVKYYLRDLSNFILWGKNAPKSCELAWLNPEKVDLMLKTPLPRSVSGSVLDSDWDLETIPFDELPKNIACRAHFVDGLPWPESGAWEIMSHLFEASEKPDGCAAWEDVVERYNELDKLFETLKKGEQFKTQYQLRGRKAFREKGGIYIHFNRHGNPVFGGGGCHRIAIAKILKLSCIPVQIGAIHPAAIKIWRKQLHVPRTQLYTLALATNNKTIQQK